MTADDLHVLEKFLRWYNCTTVQHDNDESPAVVYHLLIDYHTVLTWLVHVVVELLTDFRLILYILLILNLKIL